MPNFNSDGISIYYEVHGAGQPIVFVHGVTVSFQTNFKNANWVDTLTQNGYQVIGLDLRGHGASAKLYHPEMYGFAPMGGDVLRLLDHLRLSQADLHGYSLGGLIALDLALNAPERFRKVILGGIGDSAIGMGAHTDALAQIADALAAPDPTTIANPVIAMYRGFAERVPGNDLQALRAVTRASFPSKTRAQVAQCALPSLLVIGTDDKVMGGAHELSQALAQTQLVTLSDCNHFNVVSDQRYKDAALKFLRAA